MMDHSSLLRLMQQSCYQLLRHQLVMSKTQKVLKLVSGDRKKFGLFWRQNGLLGRNGGSFIA